MAKLTNIELEELQSYMKGKTIAVLGNGKCILKNPNGKLIDSHDVVIRMNGGAPVKSFSSGEFMGNKFDIYSVNQDAAHYIKRGKDAKYILRLNPLGQNKLDSKQAQNLKLFPNIYYAFGKQQKQIKKLAAKPPYNKGNRDINKRPSTGAWTLEFLVRNIDFKSISLFGFDFFKEFEKSKGRGNVFNSHLNQKHDPVAEREYFENIIKNYNITLY